MVTNCDVCIGGFEGDCYTEFSDLTVRKARKPHKCSECSNEIVRGERYQHVIGKSEGEFWAFDTCLICAEIRKVFSCDEGETYGGMLWEMMTDNAFPSLTMSSPCFRELSAAGKAEVIRRWQIWKGLRG